MIITWFSVMGENRNLFMKIDLTVFFYGKEGGLG